MTSLQVREIHGHDLLVPGMFSIIRDGTSSYSGVHHGSAWAASAYRWYANSEVCEQCWLEDGRVVLTMKGRTCPCSKKRKRGLGGKPPFTVRSTSTRASSAGPPPLRHPRSEPLRVADLVVETIAELRSMLMEPGDQA